MDLLKDFNFMTYIIHKMLVLLKNHLNYLKDTICKCFFRRILDFLKKFLKIFFTRLFFFITYNNKTFMF